MPVACIAKEISSISGKVLCIYSLFIMLDCWSF